MLKLNQQLLRQVELSELMMTCIHRLHGVCGGCSLQMLGGGGSQEPKTSPCSHWCRRRREVGATNTNLPGFDCDLLGSPGHLMLLHIIYLKRYQCDPKILLLRHHLVHLLHIVRADHFQKITCTFYYVTATTNTLSSAAFW